MTVVAEKSRTYTPVGGARELFRTRRRHVCIHGPAGTGKTRAVLEKLHLCMCKYPGSRGLIVRQTRKSMTESALVTYERKVMPEGFVPDGPSRAFRHSYEYPNGSEVVVGGLDKSDRVMSTEYDMIAAFEATEIAEDAYEKLDTRLRNGVMPYQQIVADCNPAAPSHWLKKRIDSGTSLGIASRHADNPSLTPEYLAALSALSGVRRARLYEGRWAQADGLVYEQWDERVNVIDAMPPGWESWARYRSIDMGFKNPFVCQWWAIDGDGRMYLYREHYRVGMTIDEHAKAINAMSGNERYVSTIADHDAGERAVLAKHGITTAAANKAVSVGIQCVSERVRPQADGRPRLFVLRTALDAQDPELDAAKRPMGLMQEIDSYVWRKGGDGSAVKEEPVKEHDHACDAMRYMVMALDRAPVGLVTFVDTAAPRRGLDDWMEDV